RQTRGHRCVKLAQKYSPTDNQAFSTPFLRMNSTSTIQKPFNSVNRQVLRHPLDAIFAPKSVAVVGATEKSGSVGRTVLWNLMNTPFGGPIYPVNPTRPSVLGIK